MEKENRLCTFKEPLVLARAHPARFWTWFLSIVIIGLFPVWAPILVTCVSNVNFFEPRRTFSDIISFSVILIAQHTAFVVPMKQQSKFPVDYRNLSLLFMVVLLLIGCTFLMLQLFVTGQYLWSNFGQTIIGLYLLLSIGLSFYVYFSYLVDSPDVSEFVDEKKVAAEKLITDIDKAVGGGTLKL